MSSTAPRRLTASANASGKSGVCAQSANVPTIAARAPRADSEASSCCNDGTSMPNSVCSRAIGAALESSVNGTALVAGDDSERQQRGDDEYADG